MCNKLLDLEEQFEKDVEAAKAREVDSFCADATYTITEGESLTSFFEQSADAFLGLCKYYRDEGYRLYHYHEINRNRFATYFMGSKLAHIYWIACEQELNLVRSETGGAALPLSKSGAAVCRPTVTQLWSDQANGMGYAVRLSDGSFIVYDGAYAHLADELWDTLVKLNGSEDGIVIRAWLITHSHKDHYPCFGAFADAYADRVRLETVMISPMNAERAYDTYLNDGVQADVCKYSGAKLLYVHTGMLFAFGDVKLEILFTADELYIAEPYEGFSTEMIDFNNTSIVSRVYSEEKSCLLLGDAGDTAAYHLIAYYGDQLKSDMCQISHHGVEDFPLIAYRQIKAAILWYPCNDRLYNREGRDSDVRAALRNSVHTKEIILHDKTRETRDL